MKVDNNTLRGNLYNNLDCVIRFTYCKVPVLRDIIRKIIFKRLYTSDISKVDSAFREFKEILKKYQVDYKGKNILEIGPGDSSIMAFNFLLLGVKRYIMIDKFPRRLETKYQKDLLTKEIDFFRNKFDPYLMSDIIKNGKPNKKRMMYVRDSAEDMKKVKDESIDLIISVSVLEHIKRLEKAFKEMRRVIREDGFTIHKIDLRDHYNFNKPMKFLTYSEYIWNNFLTKEGYSCTNRFRADDIEEMARNAGFKVVEVKKNTIKKLDLQKVHADFKGKDLKTLEMIILLKYAR